MLKRIVPILALGLLVASIQGCALITDPQGRSGYGLDIDSLYAQTIDQFSLPDGSHGVLRQAGRIFSVKLDKYQRVLDLPNDISSARIARVENIGSQTVLILETQRPNCPESYFFLGLRGGNAALFSARDCGQRPVVFTTADKSAVVMDFAQPAIGKVHRYLYTRNGQALFGTTLPTPFENVLAVPFADERLDATVSDRIPQRMARRPAIRRRAGQRVVNVRAAHRSVPLDAPPPVAPPLPTKLDLPQQSITPVKIDLRD